MSELVAVSYVAVFEFGAAAAVSPILRMQAHDENFLVLGTIEGADVAAFGEDLAVLSDKSWTLSQRRSAACCLSKARPSFQLVAKSLASLTFRPGATTSRSNSLVSEKSRGIPGH
jgi:hypothetical protein